MSRAPVLSVVIPTFNNVDMLAECLRSWEDCAAGQPVELIVVEDGCRDATPELLAKVGATVWGRAHLRWCHQDDRHELRCTNAGMRAAHGSLLMAWQDDMFLRASWFVPELLDDVCRVRRPRSPVPQSRPELPIARRAHQ